MSSSSSSSSITIDEKTSLMTITISDDEIYTIDQTTNNNKETLPKKKTLSLVSSTFTPLVKIVEETLSKKITKDVIDRDPTLQGTLSISNLSWHKNTETTQKWSLCFALHQYDDPPLASGPFSKCDGFVMLYDPSIQGSWDLIDKLLQQWAACGTATLPCFVVCLNSISKNTPSSTIDKQQSFVEKEFQGVTFLRQPDHLSAIWIPVCALFAQEVEKGRNALSNTFIDDFDSY